MPQPLAIWNSARDVWETPETEGFFCEHLDVFSGTFPTSGTMRNGEAYELPTWEPATHDSGSSSSVLFGTPSARMWKGSGPVGSKSHEWLMNHGNVEAQVLLLPTPSARLGDPSSRGASHPARRKELNSKRAGELDEIAVHILQPGANTNEPSGDGNEQLAGQLPGQQNLLDELEGNASAPGSPNG